MAETAAGPPARGCDGCDLCCRTYEIAELKKPMGSACAHLSALGCGIHGSHPKTCRTFRCLWLDEPALGEVWRPSRSGFVLRPDPDGVTLWVDVDPLRPGAWRALPYHPQIVTWSWAIRDGRDCAAAILRYLSQSVPAARVAAIDRFVTGHNVASLEALAGLLAGIERRHEA